MASIDELIERHGEETVRKAFWLQEKIFEEGIEPVDFTGEAEQEMRKIGPAILKQKLESEFKKDV